MGDGEEVVLEIDDVLRAAKRDGLDRAALLRALADVEGVYVPSLYEPRYTDDGRLSRTVPVAPGVPRSSRSAPCRTSSSGPTRSARSSR
jgi:radical SAM superfamily enzyme YgiQ (UPF0313 family)